MSSSDNVLIWVPQVEKSATDRMFPTKLQRDYQRPTALDTLAKQAICIAERSTCLFYEVGAIIFYHSGKEYHFLSSGYNGAAKGDVNPRDVGCQRIIGGKLKEGEGLCRGSHAELNAIATFANPLAITDLEMFVTLHPCYSCAKQIVNANIRRVYYLWEYGREEFVTDYLHKAGVEVSLYQSDHLDNWIQRMGFHPIGAKHPRMS